MNTTPEDVLKPLRAAVDELATRAMVETGPVSGVLPSLVALAKDARNAGQPRVADLAEELALSLAGPQTGNSMTLLDGIARIQAEIEGAAVDASKAAAPAEPSAWSADPELLSDFFVESGDHLVSIEAQLMTLEQDAGNHDSLHSIFRSFHTMKGLAGFLGFPAAHEVETLLDLARQAKLSVTPEVIDVVLASADHLKGELSRLQALASGGAPGPAADHAPLLEVVRRAREGDYSRKAEPPQAERARPEDAPA